MKHIGWICLVLLLALILPGPADSREKGAMVFDRVFKDSGWQVQLKSFAVGARCQAGWFEASLSDNRYLKLSAYKENDPDKGEFGPLNPKYAWILVPLLRQCLEFSGQNPPRTISLSMNWQFYPESQARWARAWQESRLREKWASLDVHTRYGKLTNMMSSFLVSDMTSSLSPLGFDVKGAYMEKMGWFRADALPFYSRILTPVKIPGHLKIPIPLMLVLTLSLHDPGLSRDQAGFKGPWQVTDIFVKIQKEKATLYGSFQQALGEYRISGDESQADGSYVRILPLTDPSFQEPGRRLLKAMLEITAPLAGKKISLGFNPEAYPGLYSDMVQFLNGPDTPLPSIIRPQLPQKRFAAFFPDPAGQAAGFIDGISAFFRDTGFDFSHFEVFSGRSEAGRHPNDERHLKPLGIKAEQRVFLPEISYMILESSPDLTVPSSENTIKGSLPY